MAAALWLLLSAAAAAPLLKDLFGGPNGTNLAAHAPDVGGPWSVINGALALNGAGQVAAVTVNTHCDALNDCGQTDVTLTGAALSVDAGNRKGLFVRATDLAHNWFCYWDTNTAAIINIYESAGTFAGTLRASAALTYVAAKTWNFTVQVVGTTITLTVTQADNPSNTATISYGLMATNLTATGVGLDEYYSIAAPGGWDTFMVTHP